MTYAFTILRLPASTRVLWVPALPLDPLAEQLYSRCARTLSCLDRAGRAQFALRSSTLAQRAARSV